MYNRNNLKKILLLFSANSWYLDYNLHFFLGRNTFGQLGFGDTKRRDFPEPVPELIGKNIIYAATGKHHTLFVTGWLITSFFVNLIIYVFSLFSMTTL